MLKTFTYCYAGLLAAILLLADTGELQVFSAWLHHVPFGDKTCHFVLVGGLSFLLSATLSVHVPHRRLAIVVSTILVLAVLSSLEECSQTMLSHRQFEPGDMLCNVAGTCVFGCAALLLPIRRIAAVC